MPDLIQVFSRRWKLILGLTIIATVIALIAAALSPKKFLSTATALPANTLTADKARIFNQNIEALYSDFGTSDDLDKLEGTALLDTIFIAASKEFSLDQHYGINVSGESAYKAALELKKNTRISRSGYGELKVKVWDEDRNLAAALANSLMQKIQELHQHIQNETNQAILDKLREDHQLKQDRYRQVADSGTRLAGADADIVQVRRTALLDQLQQEEKMMDQYQLAINTNPPVLLTVEQARPAIWPDRPKVAATTLITFFAAFIFSFLMALFAESKNKS